MRKDAADSRLAALRPIAFVPPLVRAILAGRKTETRRLVLPQPDCVGVDDRGEPVAYVAGQLIRCKFGRAGDQLWVQERWTDKPADAALFDSAHGGVVYAADLNFPLRGRWKPARFMPRRHSRLMLRIQSVRIERLIDISPADARAEGFDPTVDGDDPRVWFRRTWDGLSDAESDWESKPLVWVIRFEVVSCVA